MALEPRLRRANMWNQGTQLRIAGLGLQPFEDAHFLRRNERKNGEIQTRLDSCTWLRFIWKEVSGTNPSQNKSSYKYPEGSLLWVPGTNFWLRHDGLFNAIPSYIPWKTFKHVLNLSWTYPSCVTLAFWIRKVTSVQKDHQVRTKQSTK